MFLCHIGVSLSLPLSLNTMKKYPRVRIRKDLEALLEMNDKDVFKGLTACKPETQQAIASVA